MDLPDFNQWQWVLAVAASVCIGVSKTGFGGVGMLAVILMAQIMPARNSTGVVLPLLIFADIFAVSAFRRHAKWIHIWVLLVPAALGVVAGFLLMPRVPENLFRPLIGWIVLVMVVVHYFSKFRPVLLEHLPHTKRFAWFMGAFSGLTTMFANAAGPVMTLYLLARRLPKMEFVGTAACFFLIINVFKVPFSYGLGLINVGSLTLNAVLVPGVIVGVIIGRTLLKLVSQRLFDEILLAFTLLAGIRLVFG